MAVRRFNHPSSNSAFITLAVGGLQGISNGPFTLLFLVRPMQEGFFRPIFSAQEGGSGRRSVWLTSAGLLMVNTGGLGNWTNGVGLDMSDGWGLLGVSKELAGDTAVRLHFALPGAAFAGWSHAAVANPSATMPDASATLDHLRIGSFPQSSDFWFGDVAAGAVWNGRGLTDADFEGFEVGAATVLAEAPDALWLLNQETVADPVLDVTGNGADQTAITGTSVLIGDDPDWDFNFGGATVGLAAAAEVNAAHPLTASKTVTLARAGEQDTTGTLTAAESATQPQATVIDVARPLTAVKVATLASAREADTARSPSASKAATLDVAAETDRALAVTGPAVLVVPGLLTARMVRPRLTPATTRPLLVARTRVGIPAAPTLRNALLNPSMFGWPDATNTGVPSSANLTDSGPLVITTPGAVVEDLLIDATESGLGIEVRAPGVVIRRCRIITTPQPGGGCVKQVNNATGMHIASSTLEYVQPGSYDAAVGDSHYTMEWCHVVDVAEGPRFGDMCVIRHCYIHRMLVDDDEAHADGVQTTGAVNFLFERNNVDLSDSIGASTPNAAIIIGSEFGPTSGRITNNLFNGGGFTMFMGAGNFPMASMVVTGNRFGRAFAFGPTSVDAGSIDGLTWQNNMWDDGAGLILPT